MLISSVIQLFWSSQPFLLTIGVDWRRIIHLPVVFMNFRVKYFVCSRYCLLQKCWSQFNAKFGCRLLSNMHPGWCSFALSSDSFLIRKIFKLCWTLGPQVLCPSTLSSMYKSPGSRLSCWDDVNMISASDWCTGTHMWRAHLCWAWSTKMEFSSLLILPVSTTETHFSFGRHAIWRWRNTLQNCHFFTYFHIMC